MNITVIGGGSWGLALSKVLSDNKHQVLVYDINEKIVQKINDLHLCLQLNEYVPEDIKATSNMKTAIDHAEVLLFVVPTKVLRIALKSAIEHIDSPKVFINAAKGIEPSTFMRISEIVREMVPPKYVKHTISLSGPSHAEEVIRGLTTAVTAASEEAEAAHFAQSLFHNQQYFRVYTSTDLKGVELGGSLKNIFALAAGIIRGQGLGDNALAAFMARSLVEMHKIYDHLGADPSTLYGLSGIGDLIVTCTSPHSRNFQAGYKLGKGKDLEETLNNMTMVVEGIRTTEAAYHLTQAENIDTPIIDAIYDIVFNKVQPKIALKRLLSRDSKAENYS